MWILVPETLPDETRIHPGARSGWCDPDCTARHRHDVRHRGRRHCSAACCTRGECARKILSARTTLTSDARKESNLGVKMNNHTVLLSCKYKNAKPFEADALHRSFPFQFVCANEKKNLFLFVETTSIHRSEATVVHNSALVKMDKTF